VEEVKGVFPAISIAIICIIAGFYLGMYLQKNLPNVEWPSFVTKCYLNSDCSWKIINCCPESAGAYWQCVNLKTFEEPSCPSVVICPQVISIRPSTNCICENGSCVAK